MVLVPSLSFKLSSGKEALTTTLQIPIEDVGLGFVLYLNLANPWSGSIKRSVKDVTHAKPLGDLYHILNNSLAPV